MDKRFILTAAICLAIFFVWTRFFAPVPPRTPPIAAKTEPGKTAEPGKAPEPTKAAEPGKNDSAKVEPAAPRPDPIVDHVVETGRYDTELTTWGARPKSWRLTNPQYTEVDGKNPINLVKPTTSAFIVRTTDADLSPQTDDAWNKIPAGDHELAYQWENANVRFTKKYHFVPGTYEFQLQVSVENKSDKAIAPRLQVEMAGWQDPMIKPGGMFGARPMQTEGLCDINGKLKKGDLTSLQKEAVKVTGPIYWAGYEEKYFLAAIAMLPNGEQQECSITAGAVGSITAQVTLAERKIEPKASTQYEFAGFVGPKLLAELDAVKINGQDVRLGDALNYGWTEIIARPMLAVLRAVHSVIPNWGVAIILLTLLIKAITWFPTQSSMRQMREMAKLKPEMDKLKERFGSDKNALNQAVMELYKTHKINPLGGCLPMLIQMPIYIALYSMLGTAVELYRASFALWWHDLTAPDPYFVLPVTSGILMFVQQWLSPTNPTKDDRGNAIPWFKRTPSDPQQRMMMFTMPVMFTAMTVFLPAGLSLYILTNTMLGMIQQFMTNKNAPASAATLKPKKA